jgi:hypothetical protein
MRAAVLALGMILATVTPTWALGPAQGDAGRYRVTLNGELDPPLINRMHGWTLTLVDQSGAPVDGAAIEVEASVPIINRVMPTAPRVTRALGGGRYRVDGMKFDMAGRWRVEVFIGSGPDRDRVALDVDVK